MKLKKITFNKTTFFLNSALEFNLIVENGKYIYFNRLLDIRAWGDSEKKAKKAVCFSFLAIYQNYYLEEDENLTGKAKDLKNILHKLIKTII